MFSMVIPIRFLYLSNFVDELTLLLASLILSVVILLLNCKSVNSVASFNISFLSHESCISLDNSVPALALLGDDEPDLEVGVGSSFFSRSDLEL